jgi:hypothetical protein
LLVLCFTVCVDSRLSFSARACSVLRRRRPRQPRPCRQRSGWSVARTRRSCRRRCVQLIPSLSVVAVAAVLVVVVAAAAVVVVVVVAAAAAVAVVAAAAAAVGGGAVVGVVVVVAAAAVVVVWWWWW